ncbi:MAG: SDR family NAD(P)-dependent oxidoreductase [Treponema sp.]|jgi:NAD(P)-dependent dehydrogenase (short-subunit alcohol dehydrogenase family)|nr:SDR family NAD(P)-dependent oxidoreductase [Treponema sp.]
MPSVIVTGADRGLGLSLCGEYLNRGWTVFAGKYLDDYSLLEELSAKQENLHIIKLDTGCQDSIAAARDSLLKVTDSLDMFISNAALMGPVKCNLYEPPMDLEAVWNSFRVNALGPVRLVESLLPLLDRGMMKRLCFVSSEVSCIVLMKHRVDSAYPYPMSKASLNMGVRILHNQLYSQGYTFRLFHPGWMKRRLPDGSLSETALYDPDYIGGIAARYFETPLKDEHRLVLADYNGCEWPF